MQCDPWIRRHIKIQICGVVRERDECSAHYTCPEINMDLRRKMIKSERC